jgi:hypothetical protein
LGKRLVSVGGNTGDSGEGDDKMSASDARERPSKPQAEKDVATQRREISF